MPSAFITQKTLDRLYAGKNLRRVVDREECNEELADIARQGFEKFIRLRDPWIHPFGKEGCWFRTEDCESSILSKAIFSDLFSLIDRLGFIEELDIGKLSGYRLKGAAEYGDGLLFHFDIMSNAKAHDINGKRLSGWRIGSMAEAEGIGLAFSAHCRRLGNLTPIPWWINRGRTVKETDKNLQLLHNDVAEWWDILLCYLQWRMSEFANEGELRDGHVNKPSFADYIILTCQFFYVDSQSRDKALFGRLLRGEIDAAEFCGKIESSGGWRKHVGIWADDLRERQDDLRVASLIRSGNSTAEFLELPEAMRAMGFSERNGATFKKEFWIPDGVALPEYGNWGEGQIEATGRLINNLIEARGRCIAGLLAEGQ